MPDRGCEAVVKGRIAMGYTGRVQLELIHILEGSNLYLDTLGGLKRGCTTRVRRSQPGGKVAAVPRGGHRNTSTGDLKQLGMTIDYAYLDTVDEVGVILEFIQTRFLGLRASQAPFLLKTLARIQKRFGFPLIQEVSLISLF